MEDQENYSSSELTLDILLARTEECPHLRLTIATEIAKAKDSIITAQEHHIADLESRIEAFQQLSNIDY